MPSIQTSGLNIEIDGRAIVSDATVIAPAGKLTTIVGPNGSGKSTLLRAIYRAGRPASGTVWIGGHDIWRTRARENARLRAVVTQHHGETADFTVNEIVGMGRTPHQGYLAGETREDRAMVADALAQVGMADSAERYFQDLSGGERQRVLLARALAQRAPAILLDEPTNHLDVHAQLSLLKILGDLDATIMLALHDLNQALVYSDHVLVMSEGRVVRAAPPDDAIEPDLLAEVFGVTSCLATNPLTGRPHVLFGAPVDRDSPESDGTR